MINPSDITKYDRTDYELEEFFLFSVLVAGKTAKVVARSLAAFLEDTSLTPLNYIRNLVKSYTLEQKLKEARTGQYSRLTKLLTEVLRRNICLRTCSASDLESISGIGPKTARFFILHSREQQCYAVLDVHIMRWLAGEGYDTPVRPKNNKDYAYWEQIFLNHADTYIGRFTSIGYAELDLMIWNYAVSKREKTFNGTFENYINHLQIM